MGILTWLGLPSTRKLWKTIENATRGDKFGFTVTWLGLPSTRKLWKMIENPTQGDKFGLTVASWINVLSVRRGLQIRRTKTIFILSGVPLKRGRSKRKVFKKDGLKSRESGLKSPFFFANSRQRNVYVWVRLKTDVRKLAAKLSVTFLLFSPCLR